jgi:enterochelin esterase-like enzyme
LKNNPVELFIVAGDDDWNHPEGTEYNIDWQVNLLYSKYHKELEYPAELRIINGGHDWSLWNKGLIDAMKLLKCR